MKPSKLIEMIQELDSLQKGLIIIWVIVSLCAYTVLTTLTELIILFLENVDQINIQPSNNLKLFSIIIKSEYCQQIYSQLIYKFRFSRITYKLFLSIWIYLIHNNTVSISKITNLTKTLLQIVKLLVSSVFLDNNFYGCAQTKGVKPMSVIPGINSICKRTFNVTDYNIKESTKKKSFHSIFINIHTAQIVCIYCKTQILDHDLIQNRNFQQTSNDPFSFRLKILPMLGELLKNRITGQLENPEGHKKYNQGLTGLFGDRYNHTINAAIQFISHIGFFRDLILQMKTDDNQLLNELKKLIFKIQSADFRAVSSNEIVKIFLKKKLNIYSYKRRDPFTMFSFLLTSIHQAVKYFSIPADQWDYLSQGRQIITKSPINDCVATLLSLNYFCSDCKKQTSSTFKIDFVKLNIPKKRRKAKEIQKQLKEHNIESPIKKRGRSLANLFVSSEAQCPITIPQLILQFLSHPFSQKKICEGCQKPMKQKKSHFQRLPQVLLLEISRMNRDGNSINDTQIYLQPNKQIDLTSFCKNSEGKITQPLIYEFETAICFQKRCVFPVIIKHPLNKQTYVIRNESVQMMKAPANPYMICLRRKTTQNQNALSKNIESSVSCGVNPDYALPDFWLLKLRYGRQMPLNHQLVCSHGSIKPGVYSKMQEQQRIPFQVYQALIQKFGGTLYTNSICKQCQQAIQILQKRKQLEKQIIIQYDKLKTNSNCMIATKWLKKWKDFLYKKQKMLYIPKGYPEPGPIDNRQLLQDSKCRADMKKNQDFSVLNIFVWRFLKQLYGGGPQIRYKWNQKPLNKFDEQLIKSVKEKANQIKTNFKAELSSPSKKISLFKGQSVIQQYQNDEDQLQQPNQ